ncbi:MAG: DUF1049 domain-containing protein [Hyphomicrobiales bacterium]|nr:DUF1049 domain-containing protein [Hyphomicrobiales bacterium]
MKILFRIFVLLPIGLALLLFALANRHSVTVSFDPFSGDIPGFAITAPLFIHLILAGAVGALAGGFVVWWRQGRFRRAARQARDEADDLKNEAQRLRNKLAEATAPAAAPALPPPRDAA